jgi:hypothetical protein
MSESSPEKPEPSPFERFREMASRVVTTPKASAEKAEEQMRQERKGAKRGPKPKR